MTISIGSPPAVIAGAGREVNAFLAAEQDAVDAAMEADGAVIVSGLAPLDAEACASLAEAWCSPRMGFELTMSPTRPKVGNGLFKAQVLASDLELPLHPEKSHLDVFPSRFLFYCKTPAAVGGATPIADTGRMLDVAPPDLIRDMENLGVKNIQNLSPETGQDWRDFFATQDPDEAERICAEAGLSAEWFGDGLRITRTVRPTIVDGNGTRRWFSTVHLHYTSSAYRAAHKDGPFPEGSCQIHATFGDGTPLPEDGMRALRRAFRAEWIERPWQRDDVMLLDNVRVAHGRATFEGRRELWTSIGRPRTREDVARGR